MDTGSAGRESSPDIYGALVQSISDYAIYMLEPDGTVRTWNAGAERITGYTAAEIIGDSFRRFYTDEDHTSGVPDMVLEIAKKEGRFEQEGWRVRKDGTRLWAHVVIDLVRDGAGEVIGLAEITRDITARKDAERELRRSEERFRLLVQGVTDYAIYMLNTRGEVVSWNRGAQRFKGYAEDEIIGQHFSKFYTDEDRATNLPARALATAEKEGRFEQEGWRVRKDGSRMWAHVIIDPLRDDSGVLIGFAKVTRDISEKRATEKSLEQARAQLFQAQKMEAIGQLTGGVAHDFNNLLAVLLGNLELARKRVSHDPKLLQFVDNCLEASRRGAALTQRMLAFARQQDLKIGSVDVPELVLGMAELLQRSIGSTIQIHTSFPIGLKKARADANQLELALLNLVLNARDAMPDGGAITISASAAKMERAADGLGAGEYICLTVADAGEGMDEATLARAVEPFFTTKGVGKGTGLGLSMIHGFAAQSGGKLLLKSRKGHGTQAQLWLPVSIAPAKTLAEDAHNTSVRSHLRPLSILVVDDDRLVLMNTAAMLEDLGHQVHEAASARQALKILQREQLDLIITDQSMPNMTGTELIEEVRKTHPSIPCILASGYADARLGGEASVPKLNKPFTQESLARSIHDAVKTRPPARVLRFRST